jgi:hypothetical protein
VTSFGISLSLSLSLSSRQLFFVFLVAFCAFQKACVPSLIVAGKTSGHDWSFLGFLFLFPAGGRKTGEAGSGESRTEREREK